MVLMAVVGELGCHSGDTKVFTPDGVKEYTDIKVGDEVYAIDDDNSFIKTKVVDVLEYDYSGEMYHISSQRYDYFVTPNHRMIFKNVWQDEFRYKEAQDLTHKGHFPSRFDWDGITKDKFNIYDHIPKNRTFNGEDLEPFDTNDFLELVGWYISEGSLFRCGERPTKYVQIRNNAYKKEITELLDEMGLNYSVYDRGKIVIFHHDLARYLQRCGTYSKNKRIPQEIKELDNKHLVHLFSSMFKGDSCDNTQVYYTISKRLKDDFAELCFKLGYQPRITFSDNNESVINGRKIRGLNRCYEVHVSFEPKNYFTVYDDGKDHYQTKQYEGKVWCLTTEAGNFFTYRNGNIQVSGNSGKTLSLTRLAWINHFKKGRRIYSNYRLYGIPYTHIDSLRDLELMENGAFIGDELWIWMEARSSQSQINKVTSDILLKSRKRGLTYIFSAQSLSQIDVRVRNVIDFTVLPILNPRERIAKLLIFNGNSPDEHNLMKVLRFRPPVVYKQYDTREEIRGLKQKSDKPFVETWNNERDLEEEEEEDDFDII